MDKEKNKEAPWMFNGNQEVSPPEWAVGFIYVITHIVQDDKGSRQIMYVGKKILNTNRKQKIGKRAIAAERASRADGKAKIVKRVVKPSGWESYWGSSKTLHEARESGIGRWERTIVEWCFSKKNMSYCETKWQFELEVFKRQSYNDHIGNWYRHDTDRQLYEEYRQRQKEKPRKSSKTVTDG